MAKAIINGKRNQRKLAFDELKDEHLHIQEGNGYVNDAFCDVCLIRTFSTQSADIAFYMCYICNQYLCKDCLKGHDKSHRFFKKSEKERMKECFREMMNESDGEIEKMLDREDVSMVERVNVKHDLDKSENYYLTGLCGLDATKWVVCDNYNDCIKIFSIGSNKLKRYIRFGSVPYGVTAINVNQEPIVPSDNIVKKVKPVSRVRAAINMLALKREPTEQVVIPNPDISVPNHSNPDNQCLLAVTLPEKRRILIINLIHNPAIITKSIKSKKYCHSIEFSEDQIFTVCSDKLGHGPYFILVISTGGDILKTINTNLNPQSYPYLAVCHGRFYLTDWDNNNVLCINDKGKVDCHQTIEGSWPRGISVDPESNAIYMCAQAHHNVYRLDSRLENIESPFYFKSVNSKWPRALCVYRDRLYVSHGRWSPHRHCITIVRIL